MSAKPSPPATGSTRSIRSTALAGRTFEDLRFDLQFALRGLRRNPTFTVVGVAPTGFVGTMAGFTGDLWLPAGAFARLTGVGPDAMYVVPIGRLRPGVDRAAAEDRVAVAARSIPPRSSGTTVRGARLEGLLWRTDLRETSGSRWVRRPETF